MEYEAIIGLEIHVELSTESKMFCGCSTQFGQPPNSQTCTVCLGLPGSLPVINEKAIEYVTRIGLAMNSRINELTQFHRKNYYYPDMPKNYQISQYDIPVCSGGELEIKNDGKNRKIGLTRVHIEEDTGKLTHVGESGRIHGADYSLVDFNRAGIPLAEIVTEPDIRSPEEARQFMQDLKNLLEHLEISDCNMEEGSLRCDANISLRPLGGEEFGVKTEVKNMNSFKALNKALAYEIERQKDMLENGEKVVQETRHWNDTKGITTTLRAKEEAHDYRYFAEPDLVPMMLKQNWVDSIKKKLPELPAQRRERFIVDFSLSEYDASVLTSSKKTGDFFEECMKDYKNPKNACNWIMGELSYYLNTNNMEIDESAVTSKHLVQLLKLIDNKTISGKIAKTVFEEMFETGKLPELIVKEKDMVQVTDADQLGEIVGKVMEANHDAVEDLKNGNERVLGFLVGQVMKETKGKANPQIVNELIRKNIS